MKILGIILVAVKLIELISGQALSVMGKDPSGSQKLGVSSITSEDYMHMSHHFLQSYDPDDIMREINRFLNESN